ncbi:hypothetical protein EWU23_11455 [Cytophagaceae bacterium 50C-KIRBA]|uniref:Prenyltransferase n=1 Tax=Aquirufa beregesia TaxID=2516556 RepID=A0ABX0F0V0_9BACT|nr:hypothetical protein [Aquirufa beregesia]NGZ45092.1 hypothetical protein [Aquirufa beregesia]
MRYIKIAHFLSLDVVWGTLAFQALLHEIFLKEMPSLPEQISLACAVWGIYLIDRMIDRKKGIYQDERHLFQAQHVFTLQIILFVLLLLGGFSITYLAPRLIYFGLGLCSLMLIYWIFWFYGAFNRIASKEFMTALIYTLGVGASTWYRIPLTLWTLLVAALMFLLVLQNLGMYTLWEWEEEGPLKSVHRWKWVLLGVEGLFLSLLLGTLFYFDEKIAFLPFAITFAIQSWIHYFSKNKLVSRIWGELAYCSPILYFAYEFFSK